MDGGITVNLRSRGLQNARVKSFGQTQHIDGTVHIDLGSLNRIVLIVNRRGGTGQVVNFVDLQVKRKRNIVTNQFKIGIIQQMDNIAFGPSVEIIHTYDIAPFLQQAFTKKGS